MNAARIAPWLLILTTGPLSGLRAESGAPAAETWLPPDTVVVVQIQPSALLEKLLAPETIELVKGLPQYPEITSRPEFVKFQGFIQFLEGSLGTDWKTGLRKLLGGSITLGIGPGDSRLLVVDTRDADLLERLNNLVVSFARGEAEKRGEAETVASREYRGVTGWSLNREEAHCLLGSRLVIAGSPADLRAVIDRRDKAEAPSIVTQETYRKANKAVDGAALARIFVDLETLKEQHAVQQALERSMNPLAGLLFAGITQNIGSSSWLAAGLHLEEDGLRLAIATDAAPPEPSGPRGFCVPVHSAKGALPPLEVPHCIGGISLYRDLSRFYSAKEDLFPERTSGLIFFENMMAIFFSGRNFAEEVLTHLRPEIRLVVAEQEFEAETGIPRVQLPAFAMVLRQREAGAFDEVLEEAWQKAVGLISFTRGQQALPGLIIDRRTHGDSRFTFAYFSLSGEKLRKDLDLRFNFRPAVAVQGEWLILSSTEGLARDVLDALEKESRSPTEPLPSIHSFLEVDGPGLRSILKANEENLVLQNMIDKGTTRDQAETNIGLLLTVVNHIARFELEGRRSGEESGAQWTVELVVR